MEPSGDSDVNTLALQTRDLHKFYGTGRNAFHVLKGLNMDVPYGTIYGLLGASGSGKTTLLRCVLGRLPIRSGAINILGKPPGAPGHTVPGKDVGYMPQETALIYEFTMLELMYYFGILYRMNMKYTRKRTEFLKEFLNLPTIHRKCGVMSGGQKRRISFALALLHEPPLLILDEPTVGIDPLLRAKVWRHLLEITSAGNTTIVITTHYIEESRQAHVVGLMRTGKLLAQSKPDDLIRAFNVTTLEEVFLKLSEEEELSGQRKASKAGAAIKYPTTAEPSERTPLVGGQVTDDSDVVKPPPLFSPPHCGRPRLPKIFNLAALFWKQFLKFFREPFMLFLIVISPMMQVAFFCLGYAGELEDIKVYVTNHDLSEPVNFSYPLGAQFIRYINRDSLKLEFTNDSNEGIDKVKDGKAVGHVLIPEYFTDNFFQRSLNVCRIIVGPTDVPINNNNTAIEASLDVSNQQIYYTVNQTLNNAFQMMMREVRNNLSMPDYIDLPLLNVSKYVYGGSSLEFSDSVYASMIGGLIVGFSVILTATQLITERKEGVIDRTWVAGVNVSEILISQMFSFLLMLIAQVTPAFFLVVYAFDLPRKGNLFLAFVLLVLEGLVGVTFGLTISSYLNSESTALEISIGVFYPIILLGGMLWPIESLPNWLQIFSSFLPLSIPSEAVKSVLLRGWGLDDEVIWMAFIVLFTWLALFVGFAGLGLHIKK